MQSKRLNPYFLGRLLGVMIGCAVISGIAEFCYIKPLYAGVLPQDGNARYELVFWESIKDSDRPEDYEAYLQAFPKGRFAPLARARAAYLRNDNDSAPKTPTLQIDKIETIYEVIKTANLRSGPRTTSPVVGALKKGEKVRATGRVTGRNWFRVDTKSGVSGFVYGDLIREIRPPVTMQPKPMITTKRRTAETEMVNVAPKKLEEESVIPKNIGVISVAPKTRIPETKLSVITDKSIKLPTTSPVNFEDSHLQTFKDCQECPVMVILPPGRFVMGDNRGDSTEKPARTVSISQSFAIGKHEVTVREWNACVLGGGCSYSPEIAGIDPVAPVRDLSWTDTLQYTSWLSAMTGKYYRMPTEAEWEYAARGGTKSRFWWGNQLLRGLANCTDCGGDYDRRSPATTGSYDPNPFGLHDMNGGVWEWVHDCWHKNYKGAPKDGSAWDNELCRVRVLRGGSWRNNSSYIHSASRFKYDADVRYLTNGFRVARSQ